MRIVPVICALALLPAACSPPPANYSHYDSDHEPHRTTVKSKPDTRPTAPKPEKVSKPEKSHKDRGHKDRHRKDW